MKVWAKNIGVHYTWQNTIDMAPTCWLCEGRAQKRNNSLCQHFSLGESCSFGSCHDAKQFSFSLYGPLASLTESLVLELRGSESVCLYVGPWTGIPGTPEDLCLTEAQSSWFLQPKLWGIFYVSLKPWVVGPDVGLENPASQGNSYRGDLSPNIYLPCVGPAHSVSLSFILSWWSYFFIFLVIGFPFS